MTAPVVAQALNTVRKDYRTQSSSVKQEVNLPNLSVEESNQTPAQPHFSNEPFGQTNLKIKVHVLGEVQSPGVYEISISDRLSDVLKLALPKRVSQRIVQVRYPGEKIAVYDLYKYYYQGDLSQSPFLRENNIVFLPPLSGAVRIEGPVARPGLYELRNEKSINDLLELSGGLSSAASQIHPIKVVRFSEKGKKFVMNVNNTRMDRRSFKIEKGDIIIIPDIINDPKKFDYTVETIPGENLFYPTSTPNIFVMGSVTQAGPYPYKSHLRIKDYVAYASPSPQARLNNVTLIRNGKRSPLRFDEKPIPGDILVVKSKLSIGTIITAVSTVLTLTLTTLLLRDQLQK